MIDLNYLRRRAAQEAALASKATNNRAAAAHNAMAMVYFRELAILAASEERQIAGERAAPL